MPQSKKKTATKTTKKQQARPAKKCTKMACKKQNKAEKFHIYIITALSMITAILLCADIALIMA